MSIKADSRRELNDEMISDYERHMYRLLAELSRLLNAAFGLIPGIDKKELNRVFRKKTKVYSSLGIKKTKVEPFV